MNSKIIFKQIGYFLVLMAIQALPARNISVGGLAFCLPYVGIILLLPLQTGLVATIGIGFGVGLLTDMIYNTAGLNASAAVLLAFLRGNVLKIMVPAGGYESYMEVSIGSMGPKWYLAYMFILLWTHHAMLFLLEHLDTGQVSMALLKAFCSSFFTFVAIVFVQYIFSSPANNRL